MINHMGEVFYTAGYYVARFIKDGENRSATFATQEEAEDFLQSLSIKKPAKKRQAKKKLAKKRTTKKKSIKKKK